MTDRPVNSSTARVVWTDDTETTRTTKPLGLSLAYSVLEALRGERRPGRLQAVRSDRTWTDLDVATAIASRRSAL